MDIIALNDVSYGMYVIATNYNERKIILHILKIVSAVPCLMDVLFWAIPVSPL